LALALSDLWHIDGDALNQAMTPSTGPAPPRRSLLMTVTVGTINNHPNPTLSVEQ
jgi:hypothetical protein